MRIAFFGLPIAGCLLAADGHDVVLACVSRTGEGAPGLRRLRRVVGEENVLVRPAQDASLAVRVRAARPDVVVSWFWTKRLPVEVIAAAPLGGFGVHPSLLPRHRGPDPTYWTLLEGDEETGVTAHRLDAEYDTGAILASARLRVEPAWNAWELARALDRPSLRLLRDVARRLSAGERLVGTPQDEALATNAPFPSDDDQWVRWTAPTSAVLRQIRALAPSPGAATEIGEEVVTIVRAEEASPPAVLEEPGEAILVKGRVVIRTSDGAVALLEASLDGEPIEPDDWREIFGEPAAEDV